MSLSQNAVRLSAVVQVEEQTLHEISVDGALIRSAKPAEDPPKRNKKPLKGPNPLSVKKKKKKIVKSGSIVHESSKEQGKSRTRSVHEGEQANATIGNKRSRENEDGDEE